MSMGDNIEPLARAVTERIARRSGMDGADLSAWVDSHWQCAAAEIEAGLIDDNGEHREGWTFEDGLTAFRDRIARQK